MIVSTTATCWGLAICNKMHFTNVNSSVFDVLKFNARVWKILLKKVTISFVMSVCLSVRME